MSNFENKKDEFVGKAKEGVGSATGDRQLENEGKGEAAVADGKQKAADAAQGIKDKANEVIGKMTD